MINEINNSDIIKEKESDDKMRIEGVLYGNENEKKDLKFIKYENSSEEVLCPGYEGEESYGEKK